MIDYFQYGGTNDLALNQSYKSPPKIKENLFYFCYIIVFYCLCHPILYSLFTLWEALQSAATVMIASEKLSIKYEFHVSDTYIEKILVYFSHSYSSPPNTLSHRMHLSYPLYSLLYFSHSLSSSNQKKWYRIPMTAMLNQLVKCIAWYLLSLLRFFPFRCYSASLTCLYAQYSNKTQKTSVELQFIMCFA